MYVSTKLFFQYIIISSLGAVHDGTGAAIRCPAFSNYMMTAIVGTYQTNLQNLNFFSNCSKNSIKENLLTSDRTLVS